MSNQPRVEIVHVIDQDYDRNHITVYIDGQEIEGSFELLLLDPGKGWDREDWDRYVRETARNASPAARTGFLALAESVTDSPYITE